MENLLEAKLQDLGANQLLDTDRVDIGLAKVEIGFAKGDWPILEGNIQDHAANVSGSQGLEIGCAMPSRQVIIGAGCIEEGHSHLGELNIKLSAKDRWTRICDSNQRKEIDRALDANEANISLAAVGGRAILHGQEDGRICRGCSHLELGSCQVMEQLDD